jgi:hypothetical protein
VQEGGCLIVDYAAMRGYPPTEAEIHYWVVDYVPGVDLVKIGGSYHLLTDNQNWVEGELVEINHMVWGALLGTEDHDDYFEVLFEASNQACDAMDALEQV